MAIQSVFPASRRLIFPPIPSPSFHCSVITLFVLTQLPVNVREKNRERNDRRGKGYVDKFLVEFDENSTHRRIRIIRKSIIFFLFPQHRDTVRLLTSSFLNSNSRVCVCIREKTEKGMIGEERIRR